MLISALNKKLKRPIKLWEDEITSSIFGEMRHLSATDVWTIFNRILPPDARKAIDWPTNSPDKAVFDFWKRRRVEPDLCIDFFRKGQPIASLLIEVKWDAKLSPKCELVRQWSDWPHKTVPTFHIYLVKDRTKGHEEVLQSLEIASDQCGKIENPCCDSGDDRRLQVRESSAIVHDWKKRLVCISWRDLQHQENGLSPAGKVWATAVSAFLAHQGFETFYGFRWLSDNEWSKTPLDAVDFFKFEPWFDFLKESSETGLLTEVKFYK